MNMTAQKKTPTGDESVGAKDQQPVDAGLRTHEENHAAPYPADTPSFDAVRVYRGARLELIPLHVWNDVDAKGRELGKVPADGRWTTRQYDHGDTLERARRDCLNLGVRLPADVVVLDVDPRNFPEGVNSLDKLVADTGIKLSTAPHVVTGSGGHHFYFRKPASTMLLDTVEGYEGLEFKSLGRQVVAAGSVHPNGRRYEWAADSPSLADMPDLPQNVIKMARRPDRITGTSARSGELTPELLAKTLEQLDPCDFGKGQHDQWRELMMACHYATDGEGRQEFIDWCMQDSEYDGHDWIVGRRWDSLHINRDQKITTATLRMYLLEHGGDIAAPDPEDDFEVWVDDGTTEPETGRWRFLSIDEVEALPPPRWLVQGILVEASIAAIYGPPESCKSFLAVDMAMAVAGGMDWHGRAVERGGVLYIAAEGAPGLGKRMRAWKVNRGAQGRTFQLHLMRDELNLAAEKDGGVRAFVQAVTDELGPLRLIVIDTLNQTAAGADENSAKDMGRYIASMKRLRDATGATVVVVHHSGKDVSKGMRGSTALLGAMDTTVEVERATDGHSIKVAVHKQKDAERESPIRFNLEKVADSLVLRQTVAADAAGDFDGRADLIVELARQMASERGGSVPLKKLAEAVCERDGVADKTARRRIDEAIPKHCTRDSAKQSADGGLVWQEPADPRNPKLGILVRTEG